MRRFFGKCVAIAMAGLMMALLVMPMFEVTTVADIRGEAVVARQKGQINGMPVYEGRIEGYPNAVREYNILNALGQEALANTGLLNEFQLSYLFHGDGVTWLILPAPVTIVTAQNGGVGWSIISQNYEQWTDIFAQGYDPLERFLDDEDHYSFMRNLRGPYYVGVPMSYDSPLTVVISQPGIYTLRLSSGAWTDFVIEVTGDQPTQPTPTPAQSPTPPTSTQAPNLATASSWAHNGITQAFTYGLIPANLQTNFTSNATRAEFSALAVALYETATGREITGRMQFNDTNDINVQKMGYLGVVTGVGGGNFAPNNGITREQAAVMIARLAYAIGQPLLSSAPTFADNNLVSSWAVDAVGQMQATGIMGGVGNNQFAPRGDYTREQSIITMLRLFEILN